MHDPWLEWPEALRRRAAALLELALSEDIGEGDVTANCFGRDQRLTARLVARADGVLAGMPLFMKTFSAVASLTASGEVDADAGACASEVDFSDPRSDGDRVSTGDVLVRLIATESVLSAGERTALNFLQRLSGVATRTAAAVAASSGPRVMDTRKTTPGYRLLEKYAVRMGGGVNHRFHLGDAAMVKDNHKEALGGIPGVMDRAAKLPSGIPLIVEVDNLAELAQVLDHPEAQRVLRVLIDNFTPAEVTSALALRSSRGGGPEFELSGGLDVAALSDPLIAGIEAVSLGSLTHSVPALDLSLEIEA